MLFFLFIIPYVAFLIILPGIREQRVISFVTLTHQLGVGVLLMGNLFYFPPICFSLDCSSLHFRSIPLTISTANWREIACPPLAPINRSSFFGAKNGSSGWNSRDVPRLFLGLIKPVLCPTRLFSHCIAIDRSITEKNTEGMSSREFHPSAMTSIVRAIAQVLMRSEETIFFEFNALKN